MHHEQSGARREEQLWLMHLRGEPRKKLASLPAPSALVGSGSCPFLSLSACLPFDSGCFLITSPSPPLLFEWGRFDFCCLLPTHLISYTAPLKGWREWFGFTLDSSGQQAGPGCRVWPCLFLTLRSFCTCAGSSCAGPASPEARDLGSLPDPSSEQP